MTSALSGLPPKHFGLIAADCPWRYRSRTALRAANWSSRRDVEKHYATMDVSEIGALPVAALAAPGGCHLFLWVTGPCLKWGLDVMDAWGFQYSGIAFTWVKLRRAIAGDPPPTMTEADFHVGLGLTTRKNTELCLLGRRGSCRRWSSGVRELIIAPVREHSRKPDEAYRRMRSYAAGPYLELFAREEREGWTTHGNQVGRFRARGVDLGAGDTATSE